MLTEEERNRVIDYFDPWELVELLKVSIHEVIDVFEDVIEDYLPAINEIMGVEDEVRNEDD
jgi:hypothetical protein